MDTAGLFDPLVVDSLKLRNRIVMPPMATELSTTRGEVTDRLIEHYTRRSKELGLLIIEHSYVTLNGKLSPRQLGIYDDTLITGLRRLTKRIHLSETPVAIQINHAGLKTEKDVTGKEPVGPSHPVFGHGTARELRAEEIEALIEAFAQAARRGVKAGFDAIEVHGAHGFLLNQFLSPLTNRRRDRYGGPLENRMRFPLGIVARVREEIGGSLLLYRLGADDMELGGFGIEEAKKFAKKLAEGSVDVIDVSGGLCGSGPSMLQGRQGYFVPLAEAIKRVVDVPVIGVGGIAQPEFADKIVRENRVDLVAIGRALLNDPDWTIKARERLLETGV